jgi:hypothetical protein
MSHEYHSYRAEFGTKDLKNTNRFDCGPSALAACSRKPAAGRQFR